MNVLGRVQKPGHASPVQNGLLGVVVIITVMVTKLENVKAQITVFILIKTAQLINLDSLLAPLVAHYVKTSFVTETLQVLGLRSTVSTVTLVRIF